MSEPIKSDYSPHGRVVGYDGAFWCLDCKAKWGALPGNPSMPAVCVKPAQDGLVERLRTAQTGHATDMEYLLATAGLRIEAADHIEELERELAEAREEARKHIQHTEYWRDQSVKNVGRAVQAERALMWAKRSKDGYRALLNMPSEPRDDTIRELAQAVQREHLRAEQAERELAEANTWLEGEHLLKHQALTRAEQAEASVEHLQGALQEAYELAAKVCDNTADDWRGIHDSWAQERAWAADNCADDIRALSGHAHAQTATTQTPEGKHD